jgi:hypothetical protein
LLAQFLVVVDVSVVTLALPAIQRRLHFSVGVTDSLLATSRR